ncbi:MAG: HIT domain-containing protein [Gammaproteobacteria bacterium]|nr:HIT domain-containing protein [Gammaproteobacteria bacterium]
MHNCLFCKIIANEIPCKKVFENSNFLAFHDMHPKAKVHILIIPKKHIESLAHLKVEDTLLMGELTLLLQNLARELNLTNGFKTQIHTGEGGGQEVFHLHYHLLGTPSL